MLPRQPAQPVRFCVELPLQLGYRLAPRENVTELVCVVIYAITHLNWYHRRHRYVPAFALQSRRADNEYTNFILMRTSPLVVWRSYERTIPERYTK
jgi:hypothetical protein